MAVLGLDIGGTKLAAGIVSESGEVLSFASCPTPQDPEEGLAALVEIGHQAQAEAIEGATLVGIGSFGPLDMDAGTIMCPPTMQTWRDVPVVAVIEKAFGKPTSLTNDATAVAVGEWRWGQGRGSTDLLYLTISTGIGGGAITRGQVFLGATGNGGEMGHITVERQGRLCGCGRRGCLEAHASGTSIAAIARDLMAAGQPSSLPLEATAADVAQAALEGDPLAVGVWAEAMELLAQGIASLINIFEPEVVILGGGVTATGAQLLDPVAAGVRAQAFASSAQDTRVVLSSFGSHVGVIGAAAHALTAAPALRDRSGPKPLRE